MDIPAYSCCVCLNSIIAPSEPYRVDSRVLWNGLSMRLGEAVNHLTNLDIHSTEEWNDAIFCNACIRKILESIEFMTAVKNTLLDWQQKRSISLEATAPVTTDLATPQIIPSTKKLVPILPKLDDAPAVPVELAERPPRRYECTECSEVFNAFRQLKRHEQRHIKKPPDSTLPYDGDNAMPICELCCTSQANAQALAQHKADQHPNGLHRCIECERDYKSKGRLRQHFVNVHQKSTLLYRCSACRSTAQPNEFHSRNELQEHIRLAHSAAVCLDDDKVQLEMNEEFLEEFLLGGDAEGSFQFSEECWEALDLHLSDELLNQQQQQHQQLMATSPLTEACPTYTCPRCGDGCASQKALLLHLAARHALRVLNCNKCEASFSDVDALTHHKASHNAPLGRSTVEATAAVAVRPANNQCGICDRIFRSYAALVYHVKTHSRAAAGTHECPYCAKVFHTDVNLKQHLRIVHAEQRRHVCQLCDARFTTLDHLKKHVLSRHHNERKFTCEQCGKRFIQSSHLRQHRRLHCPIESNL